MSSRPIIKDLCCNLAPIIWLQEKKSSSSLNNTVFSQSKQTSLSHSSSTISLSLTNAYPLHQATKGLITQQKPKLLCDIFSAEGPTSTSAQEDVFFVRVEEQRDRSKKYFSNIISFSAISIVILLVLNLVNLIFYKGPILKDMVMATATSGYENLLVAGSAGQEGNFTTADEQFEQAFTDFSSASDLVKFLNQHHDVFTAKAQTGRSIENLLRAGEDLAQAGKALNKGIAGLMTIGTQMVQPSLIGNTAAVTSAENSASEIAISLENGTSAAVSPSVNSPHTTTQSPEVGDLATNSFPQTTNLATTPSPTQNTRPSLTEALHKDFEVLHQGHVALTSAYEHLLKVDPQVLPADLQEKLEQGQEQLQRVTKLSENLFKHSPAIFDLLGDRHPHRYLILLQNDTEARPTGGFIGSYIIVDMNDGYLENMSFHDIYELDGQIQEDITPPEDIATLTSQWRMRDSNYSPDFTLSAQKTAWFLQKQKGPSVDTVIALNQSFIQDLLAVIGPLQVEGLPHPLDADSYQLLISYIVEAKLQSTTSPKQIIPTLVSALQQKLSEKDMGIKILPTALKGLAEKKIMLYSRHEDVQTFFDDVGVSGRILTTESHDDYLNVVTTSIGGNKSDRYIDQQLQHTTVIGNDGVLQDELTIRRTHTWTAATEESWRQIFTQFDLPEPSEVIKSILGQGTNKVYIKVYVPSGSKLSDAQGIDPEKVLIREDNELGKTYFFFPMSVAPGDTSTITLRYTLPVQFSWSPWQPLERYQLYVQTPPMVNPSFITKTVIFGDGVKSYGEFPETLSNQENGTLVYKDWLHRDMAMAVLVGQ